MLGRVSVVAGPVVTTGMFDQKSEIVLDDQVVSVENALTIRTSELGSLRYGDSITVAGQLYRVRQEPFRMADGLLSVLSLERTDAVPTPLQTPLQTLDGRPLVTLNGRQLVTL
jgi:hypothetical protein